MSRLSLGAAILLLSATWASSQASNPQAGQNPTSDKSAQAVEGCLSGAADTFRLTDANGKTYYLTGDTSMLNDNIGHKVRLWGHAGSTGGGELITASGPQATFGVEKVESLSPNCK
jgi:hypothetical protein